MEKLPPDFSEFLRLLNQNSVEYLLVGGYAVSIHGYPRYTAGLDVWIRVAPENAARIFHAVTEFGFEVPPLSVELFLNPRKLVRMGVEPLRIEILGSVSGLEFDAAWNSRCQIDIDGLPVTVISLADLRVNKAASGRPQDLADLANLPETE